MPADPPQKSAPKARAGLAGARARWGPRRHVRLDELPPDYAAAIRLLIRAGEEEAAAHEVAPPRIADAGAPSTGGSPDDQPAR
jgi:hypothetical protein